MRPLSSLFAGLALVVTACAGSEPPAALPPSPPPAASPEPAASAVTTAAAPAANASAAPAASTSAAASAPTAAASPCPASMALVPGGSFTMTRPKREVTTATLCMDVNETTADEYAACVKEGKCSANNLKCSPQATYEVAGKGNHPVTCVDFEQAINYCKVHNKRLASDEEWEWIARGGPAGHTYPWGNDKPKGKACWSGDKLLVSTCEVGVNTAGDSPQGIHDLAGNVFEWTTSRYDTAGPLRIGRGGAWNDASPDGLKVTRTGPGFKATYRCGFLGIRCVVEPAKP
jgi:sulfatase modifying factor 1